ncbi:hypothetical protein [Kribbella sancticallisti]
MLVLLLAVLGVGGVLAFGLVSGDGEAAPDPGPATSVAPPASSPTPERSIPAPLPTRTVKPPTAKPPVTPSVRPPVKPAESAVELARRFVAQLNANNSAAATALGCASAKQVLPLLIKQWIEPPTKLTVGEPFGQQPTFGIPLAGTTKGSAVGGLMVVQKLSDEPLCVRAFTISPK